MVSDKIWFLIRYGQSEQNIFIQTPCKNVFPRDIERTVGARTKCFIEQNKTIHGKTGQCSKCGDTGRDIGHVCDMAFSPDGVIWVLANFSLIQTMHSAIVIQLFG